MGHIFERRCIVQPVSDVIFYRIHAGRVNEEDLVTRSS
jgi:hypothetical protein